MRRADTPIRRRQPRPVPTRGAFGGKGKLLPPLSHPPNCVRWPPLLPPRPPRWPPRWWRRWRRPRRPTRSPRSSHRTLAAALARRTTPPRRALALRRLPLLQLRAAAALTPVRNARAQVFALLPPEAVVALARRAALDASTAAWLALSAATADALCACFRSAALPVRFARASRPAFRRARRLSRRIAAGGGGGARGAGVRRARRACRRRRGAPAAGAWPARGALPRLRRAAA